MVQVVLSSTLAPFREGAQLSFAEWLNSFLRQVWSVDSLPGAPLAHDVPKSRAVKDMLWGHLRPGAEWTGALGPQVSPGAITASKVSTGTSEGWRGNLVVLCRWWPQP